MVLGYVEKVMMASELIKQLQEKIRINGDLPVEVNDRDFGTPIKCVVTLRESSAHAPEKYLISSE
jgi:hypothetical protein